ncbi:hypothetical protein ABN034_17310 [Actinopolymorpha sp. B11F2]|uniref:hypothetical protein n=1 Tax=Actinopolymorpha sp. B11F2 TaxID=3160862 RepID=UPI0032E38171
MSRLSVRTADKASKIESFAPTAGRVLGVLTLAIGAVILVDIVLEWRTWDGFTAATVVIAVSAVVWLALVRPCVVAYEEALVLRNILSDTWIPWHLIESVAIAPVLQVKVAGAEHRSVAIALTGADRRSLRRRAKRGAFQASQAAMMESSDASAFQVAPGALRESVGPGANVAPADYTLQRIDGLSRKYAETTAQQTGGSAKVERHWRWPEFGVIAAAILVAVVASQFG